MNRLTDRSEEFPIFDENPMWWARVALKLAEYEDTGLEPEEIRKEVLDAEEQGRLVVLPCKAGDTVWEVADGFICDYRIHQLSFLENENMKPQEIRFLATPTNDYVDDMEFWSEEIGKTVFLTREEAEAALRKEQSK